MIPGVGCALSFRTGGGWLLATMAMPIAAGLIWCRLALPGEGVRSTRRLPISGRRSR